MKSIWTSLIVLPVLFCNLICVAGDLDRTNSNTIANILATRDENIRKLVSIVESPDSPKSDIALAIRALGTYRAVEAVKPLVKRLDFAVAEESMRSKKALPDVLQTYPTVSALIEIGLPAMESLLEILATSENRKLTYLADVTSNAIVKIPVRNIFIQDKIKSISDEKQIARLRAHIL